MIEHGLGSGLRTAGAEPFVEVMYARSRDEAALCRDLLEDALIPSRVQGDSENIPDRGLPVLVPPHFLDDAAALLALRDQDDDEDGDAFADLGDDVDVDDDDRDETDDDDGDGLADLDDDDDAFADD